MVVKSRRWRR